MLYQVQDGVERSIAYASRQMDNAEQSYWPSEAKMLGISVGNKTFSFVPLWKEIPS